MDVILTATRAGLSNDSEDPTTWNGEANKTLKNGPQVTFYRSLIYATPSAYGKELAAKVNAGEKLTWEDLDKANWAVSNTSSSAGYIYPTMWLMENYDGKKISDLSNVTRTSSRWPATATRSLRLPPRRLTSLSAMPTAATITRPLGLCPPVSPTKPARPAWAARIPSGTS